VGFGLLAAADPTALLGTFLLQMVPIQQHGLVGKLAKRFRKEHADGARTISNQQQRALGSQREQQRD